RHLGYLGCAPCRRCGIRDGRAGFGRIPDQARRGCGKRVAAPARRAERRLDKQLPARHRCAVRLGRGTEETTLPDGGVAPVKSYLVGRSRWRWWFWPNAPERLKLACGSKFKDVRRSRIIAH